MLEVPHVELADRGVLEAAVGDAVDHEPAGAADPFAAVVLEGNRLLALLHQALVDHVEHLEERHMLVDALRLVTDDLAGRGGVLLSPDV
jgi:hypothetical protein